MCLNAYVCILGIQYNLGMKYAWAPMKKMEDHCTLLIWLDLSPPTMPRLLWGGPLKCTSLAFYALRPPPKTPADWHWPLVYRPIRLGNYKVIVTRCTSLGKYTCIEGKVLAPSCQVGLLLKPRLARFHCGLKIPYSSLIDRNVLRYV